MNLARKIADLFNIKAAEQTVVVLMASYSFFMGSAIAFFYTGGTALFLKFYGNEILPWAYLASGLIGFGMSKLYSAVQKHLNLRSLNVAGIIFLFVSVLMLSIIFKQSEIAWLSFIMFVWVRVFIFVYGIGFWGIAGRIFKIQQGKRLFSVISSGEVVSNILSFFLVPLLLQFIDASGLLFLSAAELLICLALMLIITKKFQKELNEGSPVQQNKKQDAPTKQKMIRDRFGLFVFLLAIFPMFAIYYVDFIFLAETRKTFPDTEVLASFLGVFLGVAALIELLFKSLLSGRLLNRYGLKIGLIIMPIALLGTLAPAAILGSIAPGLALFFVLVAMGKLFERSTRSGIHDPSFQVLYQAIPIEGRLNFQNFIEGIPKAIGSIIAGLALVAFTYIPVKSIVSYNYIFIPIGIIWLWVVINTMKEYRHKIEILIGIHPKDSTKKEQETEQKRPSQINNGILQKASLEIGDQSLMPDPGYFKDQRVSNATQEGLNGRLSAVHEIISLMNSENAAIKRECIQAAALLKRKELISKLLTYLSDPEYRNFAAFSLSHLHAPTELEQAFIKNTDDTLLRMTILNILSHINSGQDFLQKQIDNPSPIERDYAIKMITKNKTERFNGEFRRKAEDIIYAKIEDICSIYRILEDIKDSAQPDLIKALINDANRCETGIFNTLGLLFDAESLERIRKNTKGASSGFAAEALEFIIQGNLKEVLIPLFTSESTEESLDKLSRFFPQKKKGMNDHIKELIGGNIWMFSSTTIALAMQQAAMFKDFSESFTELIAAHIYSKNTLLKKTAVHILKERNPEHLKFCLEYTQELMPFFYNPETEKNCCHLIQAANANKILSQIHPILLDILLEDTKTTSVDDVFYPYSECILCVDDTLTITEPKSTYKNGDLILLPENNPEKKIRLNNKTNQHYKLNKFTLNNLLLLYSASRESHMEFMEQVFGEKNHQAHFNSQSV